MRCGSVQLERVMLTQSAGVMFIQSDGVMLIQSVGGMSPSSRIRLLDSLTVGLLVPSWLSCPACLRPGRPPPEPTRQRRIPDLASTARHVRGSGYLAEGPPAASRPDRGRLSRLA